MPEIREDPVSGRLALIAPERSRRPTDFEIPEERERALRCPFCPGNEELTPPETLRLDAKGRPTSGPWRVRVVPNRYPALSPEAGGLEDRGLFPSRPGVGHHEVLIETPEHEKSLAELSAEEVLLVLRAFRIRAESFRKEGRWRYLLFFKNRGRRAGASLRHSHCQLMALPFIPSLLARELRRARSFQEAGGECLFCRLAREEASGPRHILDTKNFLALTAFAPRQPLESWILPRTHGMDFWALSPEKEREFVEILLELLRRLEKTLPGVPYNFYLHLPPLGEPCEAFFHWHLELVPALTRVAGFEWASEAYIVPLAPEEAARFLREISL